MITYYNWKEFFSRVSRNQMYHILIVFMEKMCSKSLMHPSLSKGKFGKCVLRFSRNQVWNAVQEFRGAKFVTLKLCFIKKICVSRNSRNQVYQNYFLIIWSRIDEQECISKVSLQMMKRRREWEMFFLFWKKLKCSNFFYFWRFYII